MADPLPIEEARGLVLEAIEPLDSESVPIERARGRVLAESVVSAADVPPFSSSAMDGFAVPPGESGALRVAGEARAGHPFAGTVESGTAVRISTGAVVPEGTGAVVMVERTEEAHGEVTVPDVDARANIRGAGDDIRQGQTVLEAGVQLGAAALGVAASIGRKQMACARIPRVALLATGDELAAPGAALGPGQIHSSNTPALAALVEGAGGRPALGEDVPDTAAGTRAALARAVEEADVVCVTGGVSVGPHDHVKGAFSELGIEERFWRVALKPGKPTWFGVGATGERRVACFGLPGNPVSAVVTFILFVRPALRALQGADPSATRIRAELTEAVPRLAGRTQAVRCRLRAGPRGWEVTPTGPQGSHQLTSMLGAGALAIVAPGEGELHPGDPVEAELLD
ncbi:MAG: molybdopterin molybdotransferase MoeA [Thermoleophilaceae bacterium]